MDALNAGDTATREGEDELEAGEGAREGADALTSLPLADGFLGLEDTLPAMGKAGRPLMGRGGGGRSALSTGRLRFGSRFGDELC